LLFEVVRRVDCGDPFLEGSDDMVHLDGPRIAASTGAAKQLVVLLHGYGADGNDLIDIGRDWQGLLPAAAFVAPHAPEPCAMSPMGRQWFPLPLRDQTERWRGAVAAQPALDAFLDAELNHHKLNDANLALVGFSQGTMLALHAGLRRARRPASIVGYSGMLVEPEATGSATQLPMFRDPPAVLLLHGDADEVIPVDAMFLSAQSLAQAGVPCEWHLSSGVAHGIDGEGLRHGGLFIAAGFGVRPAA
jgi:phospholipase/carboxylesterase